MTRPRPLTSLTQDALQAGPLCPHVPVLSILELASRDVRQRPLCLGEERAGDHPGLQEHFDQVRHHLQVDRCPVCRRWYRNATHSYHAKLRSNLRRFTRIPKRIAKSGETLEYALRARVGGVGLGAHEGRLLWRRGRHERCWRLVVQFRAMARDVDLTLFDAVEIDVALEREGGGPPMEVTLRLDPCKEGVLTSTEALLDLEHPDQVRRVRFSPRAPLRRFDLD